MLAKLEHIAVNLVSDWPIFYVQVATVLFMCFLMWAVVTVLRWDNGKEDEMDREMKKSRERLVMKGENRKSS